MEAAVQANKLSSRFEDSDSDDDEPSSALMERRRDDNSSNDKSDGDNRIEHQRAHYVDNDNSSINYSDSAGTEELPGLQE